MMQIFGDFINNPSTYQEYLALQLLTRQTPSCRHWRNNGLSADFLADYFINLLPIAHRHQEFRDTVSYVANELLENAVKFNQQLVNFPISVQVYLQGDNLLLFVTNSLNSKITAQFKAYIQELMTTDPQELWIHKLTDETNYVDNNASSGLGLLTMLLHYQAKLGWKFELLPNNPEITVVTTLVQLTI